MRKNLAASIFTVLLISLLLTSTAAAARPQSFQQTEPDPAVISQLVDPASASQRLGLLARTIVAQIISINLLPDPVSTGPTPYPKGTGETLPPERWKDWPIVPVVSQRARQIYQKGLEMGNIPTHFSKVGDCQNIRQYFLGMFDDPTTYGLGRDNEFLIPTINYFQQSWNRTSEAVRSGFNVASVLTPINANPKTCLPGETPLDCEFRAWKPSIVIISMETWTKDRPTDAYTGYLRQIIDFTINKGAVPILATKADNLEGDNSINQAIVKLAAEYDIPLWNFWKAANPLPYNGLTGDGFHLTNAPNFFNNTSDMEKAWPWRNLTALQALDAVRRFVTK
jgi:hypothetical protein